MSLWWSDRYPRTSILYDGDAPIALSESKYPKNNAWSIKNVNRLSCCDRRISISLNAPLVQVLLQCFQNLSCRMHGVCVGKLEQMPDSSMRASDVWYTDSLRRCGGCLYDILTGCHGLRWPPSYPWHTQHPCSFSLSFLFLNQFLQSNNPTPRNGTFFLPPLTAGSISSFRIYYFELSWCSDRWKETRSLRLDSIRSCHSSMLRQQNERNTVHLQLSHQALPQTCMKAAQVR